MSGFGGFGTGSTGGGLFGAKTPEQGAGGFMVPKTTTVTTTSGITFGTPTFGTGATGGLFGAQQQTPTFGTGFGAKPGAPATGTGFTFGANTQGFGSPATGTNVPTFGAPTTQAAPTFGAPTTQAAPTFGTPTTQAAPAFGAPTTQAAPTFGTFTTQAAPTFGTPTTSTTLPTFGSFGATPLNLGTPKTTAVTGFTPAATTAPTFGTSFNFGSTTTPATSTPFGLQTTAAAPSLGTSTTTTTSTTPGLTFGVSAAATTQATTQPLGFTLNQGASTTAATATTTSLTFGAPKTTGGLTFGTTTTGFGTTATTTTPTFNLGTPSTTTPSLGAGLFGLPKTTDNVSVTTTTTTTSVGLGGIDNKQTSQGLSGTGTLEPKQAKDHSLPDPILQTLNEFQTFTKQQKSISVEISHGSSKPLKKVQEDTEAMESLLTMITSGLTRNALAVDKLKTETAQGLHQAEMAQRNHETPPGLEYDNSAPSDYFNDLVTKFEADTVRLRVQIEASEKHLRSLTQSSTISPQELTLAMRRLHETLIVLAARVQALHTTVQSQKEQYKNLRRVYFKDDINVFENDTDQNLVKKQTIYSLRSLTGPTPFSENPGVGPSLHVDGLAMLAGSAGGSIPATSTNPSWASPMHGSPNTPSSALPNSNLLGTFQPLEIPGFQLSKPPTGNKRSKR